MVATAEGRAHEAGKTLPARSRPRAGKAGRVASITVAAATAAGVMAGGGDVVARYLGLGLLKEDFGEGVQRREGGDDSAKEEVDNCEGDVLRKFVYFVTAGQERGSALVFVSW